MLIFFSFMQQHTYPYKQWKFLKLLTTQLPLYLQQRNFLQLLLIYLQFSWYNINFLDQIWKFWKKTNKEGKINDGKFSSAFSKVGKFQMYFFCFLFWWPTHEQKWDFFFIYLGNDVYVCCWFCLYLCIFMLCICTHHEKFENTHISLLIVEFLFYVFCFVAYLLL